MKYEIQDIEGIGPAFGEKLGTAGIKSTDDFLKLCCDAKGRKDVAAKTEISERLLLKWANHADMMRISGIGPQFAELLEASGVDTVKELRHRNAANLATRIAEINAEKNLANANPAESMVSGWIDAAKDIEPTITH